MIILKLKHVQVFGRSFRGQFFIFAPLQAVKILKYSNNKSNQSRKKRKLSLKNHTFTIDQSNLMDTLLEENLNFIYFQVYDLILIVYNARLFYQKIRNKKNSLYIFLIQPINYTLLTIVFYFQITFSNSNTQKIMNNLLTTAPNSNNSLNNTPGPTNKQQYSPNSEQKIKSYKSINEEQSSIQLMIRAHERIRSLQQDNQILRKHVQLLSRDNKQVIEKLGNVQNQRSETFKINQQLKLRVRELEIKLSQFQIRQQLSNLEKQNVYLPIQRYQPKQNDSYNRERQFGSIPKVNMKINNQVRSRIGINIGEQECKNNKIYANDDNSISVTKQKYYSLSQHQAPLNNAKRWEQQYPKIMNNQSCYLFKSDYGQTSSFQDSKQHCYFRRSSSQDKNIKSNDNYKYISYNFNNQTKKLWQKIQEPKTEPPTGSYSYKNGQIRTKSPLIRKNSPRRNKPSCQFHSKIPGTSNSMTGDNVGESRLVKKYNYTNWRKVNNNLTVWKYANSNQHRPIIIQR